jgi:hypothetical protein
MIKIIASLCLLVSTVAEAQYLGTDFLADMQSSDQRRKAIAIGYINGVTDNMALMRNYTKFAVPEVDQGIFFCPPPSVKIGDIFSLVRQDMMKPSADLSQPAPTLIMITGRRVWPCK